MENLSNKLNMYFDKFYINYKNSYIDDAKKFLSPNRIDVIIKILYCEYFLNISPTKYNRMLYYLHLKRWGINSFNANDSFKKNFADYENEFKKTIKSISTKSFDQNISLIPIDEQDKIIDGSHRLATCITLDKKIRVAKFLVKSPYVNLNNLITRLKIKNNNINISIIDYIVQTYIKYDSDLRIFALFPIRNKDLDQKCHSVIKQYGEIIIQKKIPAYSQTNAFNICRTFYLGAKWIGNHKNSWAGAKWKSDVCFNNSNGIIDVILFKPRQKKHSSKESLKKIKEEIRSIYNIHFHSIHSSDNQEESVNYAKIFFNTNTNLILKKRQTKFFLKLEIFLEKLNEKKIESSDFIFSGSSVLAALGLRELKDIDLFHINKFHMPEGASSHNHQIKYLNMDINELIFDPRNFFYYMNYKFLHPKVLLNLKKRRNEIKPNEKDLRDIEILHKFLTLKN